MKNPRITAKDRGLIKGALRRVFSRSELRRSIMLLTVIEHYDHSRPRVTKWSMCQACLTPTPTYLMQLDHNDPIIPIDTTLEDMTWDTVIDRIWCEENNLVPLCKPCHLTKTKLEGKLRRDNKRRNVK